MIELLELAADALGSIVNEVVFVGGATIPVWVTSPIAPALRATEDVDAVSEAVSYAAFAELEERLRAQGLRNDPSVICRWQQPQTGLVLDVMPADAAALGFTNRWYPAVLAERVEHELPSQRRVFVAGSTHEGEDEAVLAAYERLAVGHRDLVLLLAPRHPERFAAVEARVAAAGLPLVRYTELAVAAAGSMTVPAPGVVLLDAVGPLAHCYAFGFAAFVGGSLVPAGGHNVLEPARAARPILVGPHTQNAADVVERLIAGGAAMRVSTPESLSWAIAGLLAEPERAIEMGRRARALVESGQGAVERHLKIVAARLSTARFAFAAGEP